MASGAAFAFTRKPCRGWGSFVSKVAGLEPTMT